MRNKKIILIIASFILLSFCLVFVSAENMVISKNGVEYEQNILDNFNLTSAEKELFLEGNIKEISEQGIEFVLVMVDIKDTSNIVVPNRLSPDFESKLKQRKEILIKQTNAVLSTLSEDEFHLEVNSEFGGFFSGEITKEGFNKLLKDERVEYVYAEHELELSLSESGPLIGADVAHSQGYSGEGQTICVIDSGIDYTKTAFGSCSQGEFLAGTCNKVPGGYDYFSGDSNPMDEDGHGTNVAGIIVSQDSGYEGIANGSKVVALRACNGTCSNSDVRSSLQWCYNNAGTYDISVVSMSLGELSIFGQCSLSYLDDEIEDLYGAGITIVASSGNKGNDGKIDYPACHEEVISVGATYDDNFGREPDSGTWKDNYGSSMADCFDESADEDDITCFTNRNSLLDLLAPGVWISAADHTYAGTSQATPMVSGAVALLLEQDPTLTPAEIKYQLQSTGVDIYDSETGLTFKRIDVEEAIGPCNCTSWTAISCGGGTCDSNEKYYTRECVDDCGVEERCDYDVSCESGSGVTSCTPDTCDSGFSDQGIDSYLDGNFWTWERTCWKEELSEWMLADSDSGSGAGWKSDGTVYCDDMYLVPPGSYEELVVDADVGYSSSSGEQNRVEWHIDLEGGSDGTSSCSSHTSSYYHDDYVTGCGASCLVESYVDLFQGTSNCNNLCGGSCDDINYWIWCSASLYYNEYEDVYDNQLCDVPYTSDISIDSVAYGDSDIDCDIEVQGDESHPERIKIQWYVNEDRVDTDNCDDGSSYSTCDDDSGYTWSNEFSLDESEFEKGDEVYCIARGYGEDGGHGAYVESSITTVSNKVPTWTSVSLSNETVEGGVPITITANSEDDGDEEMLSMYCCNGASCTPSISNHDFCYIVGDSYPYDLSCIGYSNETDGENTVRCRIYDGEDYSSIQSDTYTTNNSLNPPNDTHKFYHKNSANNIVAWFGDEGNIVLAGQCYSGISCDNPGDNSLIFGNSTDNYIGYVNSTGDLCIESGDCSDQSANCNSPSGDSFIVKDSSNNNVIYIDGNGDLCLIGSLYENSNP